MNLFAKSLSRFGAVIFFIISMNYTLQAQTPEASFSFELPDPPCVPLALAFDDLSENAASYNWSIDGTFFSDESNPEKVFINPGTYEICLEITSTSGATDNHCEEIVVFGAPNIDFSVSPESGCPPLDALFQLNTGGSDIVSTTWDFGDGVIMESTSNSIMHQYTTAGEFSVTVIATSSNGCTTTLTKSNIISVLSDISPQFSADQTLSCETPLEVSFMNTSSGIPTNVTYSWDFGDGNTSSEQHPVHIYNDNGSFDVSLTITNDDTGCSNTVTQENFVVIGAEPDFSYEAVPGECNVTQIKFTDETEGDITSYYWEFGDGVFSAAANPSHIYTEAGCYYPTLTVTTANGCQASFTPSTCIEVAESIDVSYIAIGETSSCQPPLTVSFETEYTGDVLWDFGGAGSSTQQNPTFTFEDYGTYPVTLTATLPDGCQLSITNTTVQIKNIVPKITADVREGCAPLTVNFLETTTFSDDEVVAWEWDFDGLGSSTQQNPTFTFDEPGEYAITLTITTASGCIGTKKYNKYIKVGYQPNMAFEANPRETCIENVVQFSELSGDENIDFAFWDFGDGGVSEDFNPLHEYNDTGTFTVTLVLGVHGCFDTLVIEDYMHLLPPKAVFSYGQECENPRDIEFFDASIGADSWEWDFGDGGTSTEPNPTHTYTENGSYIVTLTVFNEETECYDELTQTITVNSPLAEFTIDPMISCGAFKAQVQNLSQNATSFDWYAPGVQVIFAPGDDAHANPEFKFPAVGFYTGMTLTASNDSGCSDVFVFTDTIWVTKVVSNFIFEDIDADCDQTFQFTDTSVPTHTEITEWYWEFGDGETSTEQNPIHTYGQTGFFEPSLTVTTASGCVKKKKLVNPIQINTPFVAFQTDTVICQGTISTFINSSDMDALVDYEWDFGDGTTSTEWTPEKEFTSPGNYKVCLTGSTDLGCIGFKCLNVRVENPIANFVADTLEASCNPLTVSFTDQSTDDAVAWFWDFGDGGVSTLQNPTHIYNLNGELDVCLTITTAAGCTNTICKEDYIKINGPTGTLTLDPGNEGCLDFTLGIQVVGENIDQYIVDFGDGNATSEDDASDEFYVENTYSASGAFLPVVILSDDQGCEQVLVADSIYTQFLDFSFDVSEVEFCQGSQTPVDFFSEINTTGDIDSLVWHFEGAETPFSNELNPKGIIFNQEGLWDVTLTVYGSHCEKHLTQQNLIRVLPAPQVLFTPEPATSCGGAEITMNNQTTITSGFVQGWNWDLGNGDFSGFENPTTNYEEVQEYVVTLTATSDLGCTATYETAVEIFEPARAKIITDDMNLCIGQSRIINTIINGTPSWSPAEGLSCTDCPNPVANPDDDITYYLTVTTTDGCVATDSISFNRILQEAPQLTVSPDTAICQGETIQIFAYGGDSPFDYTWEEDRPGLSCYQYCPNPIVSGIDSSQTYVVNLVNDFECVATDSIEVEIIGSELDILGPDRTICFGDSIQLQVMEGADPVWSESEFLSCTDCPNPIAAPIETSVFEVTITERECLYTTDITVNVQFQDDIDAGDDRYICVGQTIELNGEAVGPTNWTANGSIIASDELDITISPTQTTTYTLSSKNDLCILTDDVEIVVGEKLPIEAPDVEICPGETAQLQVTGEGTSFQWTPSEGLSSDQIANPTATVESTTTYQVVAENEFCASDPVNVSVIVNELPEVMLPEEMIFVPGEPVQLTAIAAEDRVNYTYEWAPAQGLSCTDCPNPMFSSNDSLATYTLTVTNEEGCVNSFSINLRALSECSSDLIVVPSGFSPNNDGMNDELRPLGIIEITMFRVFNRWGELVFESTDPNVGWDGTFKGKKVSTDVFVYYAEGICPIDGSPILKKGDVTVLR